MSNVLTGQPYFYTSYNTTLFMTMTQLDFLECQDSCILAMQLALGLGLGLGFHSTWSDSHGLDLTWTCRLGLAPTISNGICSPRLKHATTKSTTSCQLK